MLDDYFAIGMYLVSLFFSFLSSLFILNNFKQDDQRFWNWWMQKGAI